MRLPRGPPTLHRAEPASAALWRKSDLTLPPMQTKLLFLVVPHARPPKRRRVARQGRLPPRCRRLSGGPRWSHRTPCPPSVSSRGSGRPYASQGRGPGGSPSLTPAGPRCWSGAGGSGGCRAPGAGCATVAMGTWETPTPGDWSPSQQHPRRGLAPRVAFRHAPRHTAKSSPFTRWRRHWLTTERGSRGSLRVGQPAIEDNSACQNLHPSAEPQDASRWGAPGLAPPAPGRRGYAPREPANSSCFLDTLLTPRRSALTVTTRSIVHANLSGTTA
jgi:hypothetical protein